MKKMISLALLAFATIPAFASDETCYLVSSNGMVWSRTPELLCIAQRDPRANQYEITLRSGLSFRQETIVTFNLSLVSAARCMDCNQNVYAVATPSNSTFNALAIRFNGQRDLQTGKEAGIVRIGSSSLYYTNGR